MLYILRLLLARMATSGQRRKAEPSGRHLHHLIKKYRIETTMSALNSDTREDDPVHRRMKKTPLSAINAPVADEKTCLLKPAQPAIRGQNVATYPVHSVPPFPRHELCVSYSLCFPGRLLDLNLPPGHGLLTPLSYPRPHVCSRTIHFWITITAPVADEKTCLLKPAQPAIRGQNVATCPVHSLPPFPRHELCVSSPRIPSASLAASWTSTSRPDTDF
nr:uncharacterized protein LOC133617277 isoform X1 [Nerophis lumbriciformis]